MHIARKTDRLIDAINFKCAKSRRESLWAGLPRTELAYCMRKERSNVTGSVRCALLPGQLTGHEKTVHAHPAEAGPSADDHRPQHWVAARGVAIGEAAVGDLEGALLQHLRLQDGQTRDCHGYSMTPAVEASHLMFDVIFHVQRRCRDAHEYGSTRTLEHVQITTS